MKNSLRHPEHLSPQAAAVWGAPDLAYVKPVIVEGVPAFAICGADGTRLALARERVLAFAAARQNSLDPHSVH